MKRPQHFGFHTALSALLLAASTSLVGCGDGGGAHAAGHDDASAGADSGGSQNAAGGSVGDPGQAGSKDIKDLPLNAGEYTAESFGVNDAHPADFHPLTAKESTLVKRDETSIVTGAASLTGFTLDDAGQSFAQLSATLAPQLAGLLPIEMASANLDDDGADEIAVLGTTSAGLVLRVVDHESSQLYASHQDVVIADSSYTCAHVRAADVDGDGRAELLISGSNGTQAFARVYDDLIGQLALSKELKSGPGKEIALSFANFDADLDKEIVLFSDGPTGLLLETFDGAAQGFAALRTVDKSQLPFAQQFSTRGIRVEAGNFNGDTTDQIVVFADGTNLTDKENAIDGLYAGVVKDDPAAKPDPAPLAPPVLGQAEFPSPNQANGNYRKNGNWGWQTQVADLNGDGRDELVMIMRDVNGDGGNCDWNAYRFAFDPEKWATAIDHIPLAKNVSYNSPAGIVSVGQKDGLGRDVLVTLKNDSSQNSPTIDSHRVFVASNAGASDALLHTGQELASTTSATGVTALWPVAGDFDGDSLRVRYTGKKWMELTRPRPIVILAAPPAKDGTTQVTSNSTTTYGISTGYDKTTSQEYTATSKVTLSFELPIPGLDFLSVGASASMSQSFSQSDTTSIDDVYGIQYASAYPDNVIVFYGVLCMRYEYRVLGGADTKLVGSLMTIDVPLKAGTYKWTTDYYNQALGDRGSPIDAQVLPQKPGDPTTYPSARQRDALMAAARDAAPTVTNTQDGDHRATVTWMSPETIVGQGSGVNSLSIDLNQTTGHDSSYTTSTEYSAKAGAFISAEYSQGTDETSAYSVSVSRGTTFQGAVGDIPDGKEYGDFFYSWGLFIYPTTLAKGEQVQVVNYWTGAFGPGYQTK